MTTKVASSLLQRRWREVASNGQGAAFTVVQFNALADSLCSRESFPYATEEAVEWERRKGPLVEEVAQHRPHLVAMEEVDQDSYSSCFRAALAAQGYQSVFSKKKAAASKDGCLAAWREETFSPCGGEEVLLFKESNQQALLLVLLHRASNKRLLFAVTHLKAKRGFEAVRRRQVEELTERMRERSDEWDEAVVCGDFNDDPTSESYSFFASQAKVPLTSCYAAFPHPHSDQQCDLGNGVVLTKGEAPLTTFKQRHPTEVTCRTIDYVWRSSGLALTALLDLPWPPPAVPFPSAQYPSDHLMIGAKLRFQS